MKIVFLSRHQNQVQRGAEVFVSELSSRLAKGHQVQVLAGDEADSWSKIVYSGADVVIPINGGMQSFKASLGRMAGGYKILISGHSGIGRDDLWNLAVCHPNIFVALTERMEHWARKWGMGVRVRKIPNGVDLNKFNPKGSKFGHGLPGKIVLSVGALVWYKYHQRSIEAVAKMGNASLLIVGTGELKDQLRKLGTEKLGSRFKLIEAKYSLMPQIYRAADLFTLPSWDREAFGIAYLEALASNLPVVAPNDLSRREIIGEGGVLTTVSDPEQFAGALNFALGTDWGDKPRNQAKKFSWEVIADKYERAISSL